MTDVKSITPEKFLKFSKIDPPIIIDIRDREEFDFEHIPGAINISIFNKPQKKIIGNVSDFYWTLTENMLYKVNKFIEPQIKKYVSQLKNIISEQTESKKKFRLFSSKKEKTILVYCWKGGPYSHGFATILKEYGFNVLVLRGGYLHYQAFLNNYLFKTYSFKVLGGRIGSGKTSILYELQKAGEQILDLDKCEGQKSTRSYLASIGLQLSFLNPDLPIWVEEKTRKSEKYLIQSRSMSVPLEANNLSIIYIQLRQNSFWEQIKTAPIYRLELPIELRLKRIIADYSLFIENEIKEKEIKLIKHLGNKRYALVVKCLESGNFNESAEIILKYYDSYYNKRTYKRNIGKEIQITLQEDSPEITAKRLINEAYKDES